MSELQNSPILFPVLYNNNNNNNNNNKRSNNFDEWPHHLLVTSRGDQWIRLTLTLIQYVSLDPQVSPQNGISIGSAIFVYTTAKSPMLFEWGRWLVG